MAAYVALAWMLPAVGQILERDRMQPGTLMVLSTPTVARSRPEKGMVGCWRAGRRAVDTLPAADRRREAVADNRPTSRAGNIRMAGKRTLPA
jgi:hypothetical protein